jgi:hypothetical protein
MKHIKELIAELRLSKACLLDEPSEVKQHDPEHVQDIADKLNVSYTQLAMSDALAASGLGFDY